MDTAAAKSRGSVTYLSSVDLGTTAIVSRSHRVATQTLRTMLASTCSSPPPSPTTSSSVSPSRRGAPLSSTSPCSGNFVNYLPASCYVYDDG
eukprot:1565738-Alexandrium_andersonii.AAC.1